jgi:hypothetical protein
MNNTTEFKQPLFWATSQGRRICARCNNCDHHWCEGASCACLCREKSVKPNTKDSKRATLAESVGDRLSTPESRLDVFRYFIKERYQIMQRRRAGLPRPWTNDPILQAYRFTNVYREDDAVTKSISDLWRTPYEIDVLLWFAMVIARFFNLPSTLEAIGYPIPYDPEPIIETCTRRQRAGQTVFGGAYVIPSGPEKQPKVEYLCQEVFAPLWRDRERITEIFTTPGITLAAFARCLGEYRNLGGGFMCGQVIADVKFVPRLLDASDWWTFALPGPGSERGMNRLLGRSVDATWNQSEWHAQLLALQATLAPMLAEAGMLRMSASDTQNCLCELDKYLRTKLGEGTPKQRFEGKDEAWLPGF